MHFFLTGWLVGLSIAIPFGPVSMMCVEQSLTRGVLKGLASGAGAATSHGFYATLAVFGAHAAATSLANVEGTIHLMSGAVFALLGIRTMLRSPAGPAGPGVRQGGLTHYAGGLALALANPMTLLPYVAFAGTMALSGNETTTLPMTLVAGIALGTLCWYWTISSSAWLLRQRLPRALLERLNLVSGAILIAMGALTALR